MLTDPNVVLYSIIMSGLLSMSVMKDTKENVWLSNAQCNEKSVIPGRTIQGLWLLGIQML